MNWESKKSISELVGEMRARVSAISTTVTISEQQNASLRERAITGPVWVSKFAVPPPQKDDVRTLLLRVVDGLADGNRPRPRPQSEPIRLQWTGYRAGVRVKTPELLISEREKYTRLMKEVSSPVVIFFLYGGAFLYVNIADAFIPRADMSSTPAQTGLRATGESLPGLRK